MTTTNHQLAALLGDKTTTFEVLLELTNEGRNMNYWESFEGTFEEIVKKCQAIVLGLKATLTKGHFEVKIEYLFENEAEVYIYVNENSVYMNNVIKELLNIS